METTQTKTRKMKRKEPEPTPEHQWQTLTKVAKNKSSYTGPAVKRGESRTGLTLADYERFLKAKVATAQEYGFVIDPNEINPILKPHQRDSVCWAVRGGRRAIFASFGLGKSLMQLETLRLTLKHAGGGRALIVAPLGVRQEFKRDAWEKLGFEITFVRSMDDVRQAELFEERSNVYITNYETVRDGKLNPAEFTVTTLDEAAILRGFGGTKTFREFMRLFARVKYRFVATATPDPNEYIEMLAYSAYLGIQDVSGAKTRFFKRDSVHADKLTLHPHKEEEFWMWVATWALFINKPSDLGHSDEGYDLPPMEVIYHEIPVDHNVGQMTERNGQARLFRDAIGGITAAAKEKRDTLDDRVRKMVEIINDIRREEGILQELLLEKQGKVSSAGAIELPEKQGALQGAQQEVEGSQPGTNGGAGEESRQQESGQDQSQKQSVVRGKQNKGQYDRTASQAAKLRLDARAVRRDGRKAESSVPDMSGLSSEIGSRSRSSDGSSEGAALPNVQRGIGSIPGQRGSVATCSGVSSQYLVWCDLNKEQKAIEKALRQIGESYTSLDGSDTLEERDQGVKDWRDGLTSAFVSKPMMYGAGINMQQCHIAIFSGIGFKFAEFIQAIHRIYRFLQTKQVKIHIIYAESERGILATLKAKWDRYNKRAEKMSAIIKEFGLSQQAMMQAMQRSMGCERVEVTGNNYTLVNNDSVEELRRMESDSVGLVLTSIPFSTQYEYSPSFNDFGHTESNKHFFEQMDFLTPELLRVLKPGRIAAIHVKDRIVPGGLTGLGFQTLYPFHLDCVTHYTNHGFALMGIKTIVTDVVRENNQTYRLGWTEQCKDGSKMGYGLPEYILYFRKPPTDNSNAYGDEPVKKQKKNWIPPVMLAEDGEGNLYNEPVQGGNRWQNPNGYSRSRWQIDAHGFARSNGNRSLTPEELAPLPHHAIFKLFKKYSLEEVYDFEYHVKIGEALEQKQRLPVTFMLLQPASWHPDVWTDITRMRTLNGAQSAKGRVMHLCPMQFDIADRVIAQLSNEGDVVLDPFSGLGTVARSAVMQGRKGYGIELAPNYFADSCLYLEMASREKATPSLFDLAFDGEVDAEFLAMAGDEDVLSAVVEPVEQEPGELPAEPEPVKVEKPKRTQKVKAAKAAPVASGDLDFLG